MRMDELWVEVETYVKAAHDALPPNHKETLRQRGLWRFYQASGWRQVCYWLKSCVRATSTDERSGA